MKRFDRFVLLAACMAALPVVAPAQPLSGLYVGAGAGLTFMQSETDAKENGIATPGKSLQFNPGAVGVGSVGWGYGNGLRAEVEFDYRYNSISGATFPVTGQQPSSGTEQKFGPMVNALYDFNGISPLVVPYAGVGVGYQWVAIGGNHLPSLATGTRGAFAYQGIAGASVPVPWVSGLAMTAEYRFMGLAGDRTYDIGSRGTTITRTDDFNHSILVGLRYAFGAPPPPAPLAPIVVAVPAAAPARSYLVFFDWDKATLTARAEQIVKDAAESSTKTHYTKIEVNGYTDTSGTPAYNQGLSIRRAQAVAAELVKDGVPKTVIAIQGFGETHLLVPTGAGVREPQNRRVEIIIR